MDREQIRDTVFDVKDELYNKTIKAIPRPEKEIGVDLEDTVLQNIINSFDGINSFFDVSALDSFTNLSRSRNDTYQTIDYMSQDSSLAAILETYAEDATETNDNGDIVWVESSDESAAKYITYLLNSLNVNKNIYAWTHSLCKYGDIYIRLYRESEYDSFLFDTPKVTQEVPDDEPDESNIQITNLEESRRLDEDVKIKSYSKNDKYVHYVEMVDNPAQVFELTRFGKTAAYLTTKVDATQNTADQIGVYTSALNKYRFNKNEVNLYQPTEFVHASLQDNAARTPEEVELFTFNHNEEEIKVSYKVKRGQSLFTNAYKVWRQLQLLENSVLLNRVTRSSIVRMISVEVGDMPKESVGPHLLGIKQMIEQKASYDVGNSMSEYTNPGPIINNVYIPTREGKGNITTSEIGGDVDVKGLADLDYYQDKFYGSLRVPKAYFGVTDDGAGFNGGQSLSIISSRYAKMIKRIQNVMCQLVTDIVNLILLDTGNQSYINNFVIKMLPPTTQEEVDRRDNVSNKVGLVRDIMDTLAEIENPITKLKILKSLLSSTITDVEVIQLLQEEIDAMEQALDEETLPVVEDETNDFGSEDLGDLFSDTGTSSNFGDISSSDLFSSEETGDVSPETTVDDGAEASLPSPADLDIGDMSDSTNPALG